jgi:hypothetical protein
MSSQLGQKSSLSSSDFVRKKAWNNNYYQERKYNNKKENEITKT